MSTVSTARPAARTSRPHPSRIARRLALNTAFWTSVVEYDATERWYTRIGREEGWEAWLLSWLPGQGTDWHDHGGSAGAFTVLHGRLDEQTATPGPDGHLVVDPATRSVVAGGLRAFGGAHLHRVDNRGDEPAVSLHVYAPRLDTMHDYVVDPGHADRLLLAATRRAGLSW